VADLKAVLVINPKNKAAKCQLEVAEELSITTVNIDTFLLPLPVELTEELSITMVNIDTFLYHYQLS
jgi:hypothetical protein